MICFNVFRFSESEDAAKIVLLNLFPNLRYLPFYRKVYDKTKKYTEDLSSGKDMLIVL